jgi:prevent-host-death family protein
MDETAATETLANFIDDAANVVARVKSTRQPIYLTVDGKTEIVIQDAATYDQMVARAEVLDAIYRSREDIAAGRTEPMRTVVERLGKTP